MKDRCEDEIPLKRTARQAAGRPKKAAAPTPPRIPRMTRLMALAIKFQDMIDRGEVKDYADLARLGHVSRARITQIMNLLNLAPEIQAQILSASQEAWNAPCISEQSLRRLTGLVAWSAQRAVWGNPHLPTPVARCWSAPSLQGDCLGNLANPNTRAV